MVITSDKPKNTLSQREHINYSAPSNCIGRQHNYHPPLYTILRKKKPPSKADSLIHSGQWIPDPNPSHPTPSLSLLGCSYCIAMSPKPFRWAASAFATAAVHSNGNDNWLPRSFTRKCASFKPNKNYYPQKSLLRWLQRGISNHHFLKSLPLPKKKKKDARR